MSGIMAAVAGTGQNVIYANGLYNTTYGVETSPIDNAGTSENGDYSVTYQWIGYYRPASSSAIQLGAICNYAEYYRLNGGATYQYNWGGGGNSTCYIWTGNTAKSGYNSGNATAFIQNGTSGTNFTATANSYVPIRIQWSTDLPYFFQTYGMFQYIEYFAQSSFTFLIGGTSSISGRIFYNTLTNGF
jgi:hypothetical protein